MSAAGIVIVPCVPCLRGHHLSLQRPWWVWLLIALGIVLLGVGLIALTEFDGWRRR